MPASAEDATPSAPRGPGRPKLGVVAREVTLLPRHWDWLGQQSGGASVALRRLVEEARRTGEDSHRIRQAQEAAYRFMTAMAGNEAHYEEATRELEKAIELKPADPVVNDHLGDAYWRMGRKLDAHFQWNHARDMGPEPEDLPAILKKIDSGLPEEPQPAAAQTEPKKDGG